MFKMKKNLIPYLAGDFTRKIKAELMLTGTNSTFYLSCHFNSHLCLKPTLLLHHPHLLMTPHHFHTWPAAENRRHSKMLKQTQMTAIGKNLFKSVPLPFTTADPFQPDTAIPSQTQLH